jgi:hypothetical protein
MPSRGSQFRQNAPTRRHTGPPGPTPPELCADTVHGIRHVTCARTARSIPITVPPSHHHRRAAMARRCRAAPASPPLRPPPDHNSGRTLCHADRQTPVDPNSLSYAPAPAEVPVARGSCGGEVAATAGARGAVRAPRRRPHLGCTSGPPQAAAASCTRGRRPPDLAGGLHADAPSPRGTLGCRTRR